MNPLNIVLLACAHQQNNETFANYCASIDYGSYIICKLVFKVFFHPTLVAVEGMHNDFGLLGVMEENTD